MNEFESFANEVVGPIQASISRKMAIHEELLSHLNESADRATTQGVVSEDLTARVLERFGDVTTVRGEIEASIPVWQRLLHIRMFDRRDGEGDYRYGARMSGYASTMIGVFVVLSVVVCWMKKGFLSDEMLWLLAGPFVAFVFALGMFVLDIRIRRNVQHGKWGMALVQTIIYSATLGLVPVAMTIAGDAVEPGIPHILTIGKVIGVGLFAFMVPTSLGAAYWATRNCPWIEDLGRDI